MRTETKKEKIGQAFWRKLLPSYAIPPLAAVVIVNFFSYWGGRALAQNKVHTNMEIWLDRKIPFLPWTIVIYLGCYLFWIANYVLCAHLGRERALRFYASEIAAKLVCFLFFVFLPTTVARPEIQATGLAETAMVWLYNMDPADNLFPSIHCLVSWFSYIAVRGQKKVPGWYRKFSLLFAVLVCISTLTTKQHVIADVIGGVALAELSFQAFGLLGVSGAKKGEQE